MANVNLLPLVVRYIMHALTKTENGTTYATSEENHSFMFAGASGGKWICVSLQFSNAHSLFEGATTATIPQHKRYATHILMFKAE